VFLHVSSFATFATKIVFRKEISSFATFASVLMGIGWFAKVDAGWSGIGRKKKLRRILNNSAIYAWILELLR